MMSSISNDLLYSTDCYSGRLVVNLDGVEWQFEIY